MINNNRKIIPVTNPYPESILVKNSNSQIIDANKRNAVIINISFLTNGSKNPQNNITVQPVINNAAIYMANW